MRHAITLLFGRTLSWGILAAVLMLVPGVAFSQTEEDAQTDATSAVVESVAEEEHEAVADMTDELEMDVVADEPPAAQEETPDLNAKPSDTAVWVPGYWRWNRARHRYVWVPGSWREPPSDMVWHAGYWEKTEGGWVWIGGYWGKSGDSAYPIVKSAPPPLKTESKPLKPGPAYVWIAGHWKYSGGTYVWVAGHWTRPPKSDRVWVSGHWVKRPGGYVYIPGHWDYSKTHRIVRPYRRRPLLRPRLRPYHPPRR